MNNKLIASATRIKLQSIFISKFSHKGLLAIEDTFQARNSQVPLDGCGGQKGGKGSRTSERPGAHVSQAESGGGGVADEAQRRNRDPREVGREGYPSRQDEMMTQG